MGASCGFIDPVDAAIRGDLGELGRGYFPASGLAPSPEPLIARIPIAVFRRTIAPFCAEAKPPEYNVDNHMFRFRSTFALLV